MIKHKSQHGAAMLLFTLFLAFAAASMVFALNQSIFSDLRDFNQLARSKQAYLVSEAAVEDSAFRLVMGNYTVGTSETVTLAGVVGFATTTYNPSDDEYTIEGQANNVSVERSSRITLSVGAGSAFNYGLQAGNGGITMTNSAAVVGNVYSNGPIVGANRSSIFGDVVSAGSLGLIEDVHATGSVYAHFIDDIETDVSAHYTVDLHPTGPMASDVPAGQRYTPVPDQATTSLPLSTTTIQEWKDSITDVEAKNDPTSVCFGGGTYVINTDTPAAGIGYTRYECSVQISGNNTDVILNGPIWVEGNLTFTLGPNIRIHSSLGRKSVQMIVSSSTNRTTSSKIDVAQSTSFDGSGDDRSFIMLLSENNSASSGGSQVAINLGNSAQGDLLVYSADGLVSINQQINLTEVTGYRISIGNNSTVTYESGLANLLFTAGPGGAYVLSDWRQVE
jgi:hypothetical protein